MNAFSARLRFSIKSSYLKYALLATKSDNIKNECLSLANHSSTTIPQGKNILNLSTIKLLNLNISIIGGRLIKNKYHFAFLTTLFGLHLVNSRKDKMMGAHRHEN